MNVESAGNEWQQTHQFYPEELPAIATFYQGMKDAEYHGNMNPESVQTWLLDRRLTLIKEVNTRSKEDEVAGNDVSLMQRLEKQEELLAKLISNQKKQHAAMFKLREMLEEIRTDMEPMTDMRFIRDQVNTAAQMKDFQKSFKKKSHAEMTAAFSLLHDHLGPLRLNPDSPHNTRHKKKKNRTAGAVP